MHVHKTTYLKQISLKTVQQNTNCFQRHRKNAKILDELNVILHYYKLDQNTHSTS